MHILIINLKRIPVFAYGGTERVIWDLAASLTKLGVRVTFLAPKGSSCPFADVRPLNLRRPLREQIPRDVDLVHFQFQPDFDLDADFDRPYLYTEHGNLNPNPRLPLNTVCISQDHARRHATSEYIYNGLDWDSYGPVDFACERPYFHFLGKAALRSKNVEGAMEVARGAGATLAVLGGHRLQFSRRFRLTLSPRIQFHGMVGGQRKLSLLNRSRGLIFPVRWNEPFGLAMIESLYFGAPVFGTTYGSLRELIRPDVGFLSNSRKELTEAVATRTFDPKICHAYARTFDAKTMARNYLTRYERILSGERLNATPPFVQDRNRERLPW